MAEQRLLNEVGDYVLLDMASHTPSLMQGIARESTASDLQLTAAHDRGAPGAGLTPNAVSWFNANIAAVRARALSRIESDARSIRPEGGGEGMLEELANEQAEMERQARRAKASQEFQQQQSILIEEHSRLKVQYVQFRDEEGREAKIASAWQILLALCVVLLPESLLNYSSFRVAPFIQSSFMAMGLTFIVGLAIAVSGHMFGSYIRRYNYYRRGDDHGRERSGTPWVVFSFFLLAAALAVVGVSRFYYLVPKIAEAIAIGSPPPNLAFSIAGLLLGNLLCFLLGATVAFLLHDPNPEFEDTAKNFNKVSSKLLGLRNSKLEPKLKTAERRYSSDRDDNSKRARALRARPGYAEVAATYEAVKAKDKQVIAALQDYRDRLVHEIAAQARNTQFRLDDYNGDPLNTRRLLKPHEYANHPISLSVAKG